MAEYQKSEIEGKTLYRVVAWWNTQRGSQRHIAAETPRAAIVEGNRLIESGEWDIGDNRVLGDSDGPTNLEVYRSALPATMERLAEDLSEDERLNRAAPKLLAAVEGLVEEAREDDHDPSLVQAFQHARAAIAEAKGEKTG